MNDTRFTPARGVEAKLLAYPYTEGMIYFATDSGRIFLDSNGKNKTPLGGGGVSVIYGDDENVIADDNNEFYTLHIGSLAEGSNPKINDLIINSDGKFYKVQEILSTEELLICTLIAVSGNGTDTPSTEPKKLELVPIHQLPSTLIWGRPYNVTYKATSQVDDDITYFCKITNKNTGEEKPVLSFEARSGEEYSFDVGSHLFKGTNTIYVWAEDYNNNMDDHTQSNKNAIELALKPDNDFDSLKVTKGDAALTFRCVPVGENLTKKLTVKVKDPNTNTIIDNIEQTVSSSNIGVPVTIPGYTKSHGYYILEATLSYGSGAGAVTTDPLVYEVAWAKDDNIEPIIWMDRYPAEIVDHDKLNIYYRVYDPRALNHAETRLFVNQLEIPTSPIYAYYNHLDSVQKWEHWQITNYTLGTNEFLIQCGKTKRPFRVKVVKDTIRDLDILSSGLLLNLDSKGRSNKENQSVRTTWEYTNDDRETTSVIFNNFNWYNNGWILDEDENSCLRISNGASIKIPLNVLSKQGLTSSLTFEFQFKLRNVQNYSTLIKTTSYENENGEVIIEKTASTEESVFGKYFNNNIGLCLGTQEAFFKTGFNKIVNGRYKEDEIVNVAFVIEKRSLSVNKPLIYIYINGIMSGITTYNSNDDFSADLEYFEFNSQYCDVDLYKMRVYKVALTSSNIVHNYIADYADADLYDVNQILDNNSTLPKIDFEKMLAYNAKHPDDLIMPYAVLTVREGEDIEERLPYVKGGKIKVNVDFVNPSLDKAYEKGEITGTQYLEGCPSFHAEGAEFDVQGTSSQGYPRRNYKGKFKSKPDAPVVWNYTNGPLKGQSLQDEIEYEGKEYKYYYMDNKDASESTFTWKADYMESSGTHNTGFTSFVKTLYDYHPLKKYDEDYVTGDHRTTIYGFPMLVFQYKRKTNTYEFIGKYNFNLDKACNNVIDFKNGNVQPYVLNNPNVDVKYQTYTDKNGETQTATYEMIAECWEFKNNQGNRCSFRQVEFENPKGELLEVLDDLEYRYSYYEDEIDEAIKPTGTSTTDPEIRRAYILEKMKNLEKLFIWLKSTELESAPGTDFKEPVTIDDKVYYQDNVEYRKAKFTAEFSEHFDAEYCYIYFIMTELILGYDSRGKNMMLGTWGPQKSNGDYIWFPIFYDVDTQLGVNNSGVPTWEYDTDATKEGQFSTSNSILWNNLWECFSEQIKEKYRDLRKKLLTIENLNGYYDFNPEISKSYAMKGKRPLVAYNVDEYYKYIDPAFNGYINTSGKTAITETFFYCLQGTRELQRELFLKNRFNYLDSEWLAGPYSEEAVLMGLAGRFNANNPGSTSDKFLNAEIDLNDPNIEDGIKQKYETFIHENKGEILPYKQNPLDTDTGIKLKPYLNQYVTLYFDKTQTDTIKYDEKKDEYCDALFPESIANSIKNTPLLTQQLVKVPAPEYISSLGDLSTLYLNEFWLNEAIRIKDLQLGNEDPNYINLFLEQNKVSFMTEAKDAYGKPNKFAKGLLETLILTNLAGFNSDLDISGSEKLKTCRALGTNMTGFTFAEGVQLETLYLPKTTASLVLIEPVELNGLLSEKPVANADGIFPKGLYIEGLTDLEDVDENSTTFLNEINIIGGKKLYYDSYNIVDKAVKIKTSMQNKSTLGDKLKKDLRINLENIQWTPYRLVEYGETMSLNATYCKLLDNYTFDHNYIADSSTWEKDTLNQKVYEYNEELFIKNSNTITNLDLFDTFKTSAETVENYFTGASLVIGTNRTYPYISGNVFINNSKDNPISEFDLKDIYKDQYFKDLNIFVKYVDPAYTAKFIQIMDNGQEVEWDIHKYKKDTLHPTISEKEAPEKLHYDFLGWSENPNGTIDDVINPEDFNNFTYDENNTTYTFYAVFAIHKYEINFINPNNPSDSKTIYINSGEHLHEPEGYLPYRDSSNLASDKVYKFVGYSDESDLSNIVDVTEPIAVRDYTFYAVFEESSVYDNIIDTKYFDFSEYKDGYLIKPAENVVLKGKVTIPAQYNNKDIIAIGNFEKQKITHMFFDKRSQLKEVKDYAFYKDSSTKCSTLEYFEFIDSIERIGIYAFANLGFKMSKLILPKNLKEIGMYAFRATYEANSFTGPVTIIIGSKVTTMGDRAISNLGNGIPTINGVYIMIGEEGNPSELLFSNNPNPTDSNGRVIYDNLKQYEIDFYTIKYKTIDDYAITISNKDYTVGDCIGQAANGTSSPDYTNIVNFLS